ncbi:hypothetical protein EKO27_g8091 [Xylaria grammica]|uniref:Uncharacterized protein n=1 Tax=Xylaria grammica TaxID=363999 RepID=A0A439CXS4_9PEZI|nr:hypothetical protein EKO27_g8091 [Xylaria grammica]
MPDEGEASPRTAVEFSIDDTGPFALQDVRRMLRNAKSFIITIRDKRSGDVDNVVRIPLGSADGSDDVSNDGSEDGSDNSSDTGTETGTYTCACTDDDTGDGMDGSMGGDTNDELGNSTDGRQYPGGFLPLVFSTQLCRIISPPITLSLVLEEPPVCVNGDTNKHDRDYLNALLDLGADVEAVDNMSWRTLITHRHQAGSRKRLHGVDLNARTNQGQTPMSLPIGSYIKHPGFPGPDDWRVEHWRENRDLAADMLLRHGASAQERRRRAHLVGGGADANATTHNGETPLMAAVDAALEERIMKPEFERMVEYLVSRGADIAIKDVT